MRLFTEAFLDRWEARATNRGKRWERETPAKWYVVISPDLILQPTEKYTLRMYIRKIATGSPFGAILILSRFVPLVYLWLTYPAFFQNPRLHKSFIGMLSQEGYYLLPWMALFLLTFNALVYLPRFYFWNRRAERLRRETPLSEVSDEATAIEAGVWPPPPKEHAEQ